MVSSSRSPTHALDSQNSRDGNSPPSTIVSNSETSPEDYLNEIRQLRSQGIYYAADENISSQCEFIYSKDVKGEKLVPKNDNKVISEFILTGVFEIDAKNYFMTSDGKWNSNNTLGTRFDQVKPTCHLLPVRRNDNFSFSINDFPAIISNIRAIESMGNPRKSRDTFSTIIGDSGQSTAIRLTHHLFVVCRAFSMKTYLINFNIKEKKPFIDLDDNGIVFLLTLYTNRCYFLLEFTINDWPVPLANEFELDNIKSSHDVQQLPAYDIRGDPIHPSQYEEKLAGAIARVCFTLIHFDIKQKHVFNALVRDITVLRPPTTIASTTLKHILHPKKKGKQRV
jgi:hypothetical protein